MPDGYPTIEQLSSHRWLPVPRAQLPFRSIVAASRNDPLASFDRVESLARAWGSRLVDLGDVGHLNPASGFGEWPRAEQLINVLCLSNGVRDYGAVCRSRLRRSQRTTYGARNLL